ncbi:class I SAM-dependent methyltransferase [Paenibacillus sp. P25]|nr:class I SAM-dependent methyltransferase [Paenibacillus sp. P25]
MLRLSRRLEMIAEDVPAGDRLADIGSDHALLPSYLAERGIITHGIAGEVNPGPLEAAMKQVNGAGLADVIEVRHGDGLEVIAPGEVDVITIAGMGGALITSILDNGRTKLSGVNRLILQPNVGESIVRRWLLDQDWVLISERILEEEDKIYEILTAVPSSETSVTNRELYSPFTLPGGAVADVELLLHMGPYFIMEASPVWMEKWRRELSKLERICGQLTQSSGEASRSKLASVRKEMKQIEEVLECTLKAKPSSS